MKAPKPREGYVDRGMLMRAYPTYEQVLKIEAMQPSLRAAWNWLVHRIEEPLKAREAKAIREGLIGPAITKPCYDGLQTEESKQVKLKYIQDCKDRRKEILDLDLPVQWRPFLSGPGSEAERLGLKHGYQVLNNYLEFKGLPKLPAQILMNLEKNFKAKPSHQNKKNYKKDHDLMPIQVTSGDKIRSRKPEVGEFGLQRRCNFEVFLPQVGWIACYCDPDKINLLMTPGTTTRDGCSLKWDHGKWFASIRTMRRNITNFCPQDNSVCGIDPGLDKIATVSDRQQLTNVRNLDYEDNRRLALSIADLGQGKIKFLSAKARDGIHAYVHRTDAKLRRKVLTQCRQFAAKLSTHYRYIGIESNSGIALGIGSRYTSATKILLKCLTSRCGSSRVYEIDSFYNSQTCSNCGHHDKEAWARKLGNKDQVCTCLACGFTEDRDINSACNVRNGLAKILNL